MNTNDLQTKSTITTRLIAIQCAAYAILLFLIVGDEVFDFPHRVFGAPATPVNWAEVMIEGGYIVVLAVFTIGLSVYALKRIKFLEGLLPICSYCKKIREGDAWLPLESYMFAHSEALFSHGICPECARKYHGDVFKR